MITVYKKKPSKNGMELVTLNDIYFNKCTAEQLDDKAAEIIENIDQSKMLSKYTISSRFNGTVLNIDKLSTGCKTALNIMYNPDKIFDICECGDNALDVIYALPQGNVYCSYPFISFEMDKVNVCDKNGTKVIDSYDALKEWWTDEN
jgi:hypothetical protein